MVDITGLGAVASFAEDVVDKIFPDKVAQAKDREAFILQARTLDIQAAASQTAVNQAEAANASIFVAGWRPFIGWACGVIFVYHFLVIPLIVTIMAAKGTPLPPLPQFDVDTVKNVLEGLLGIYGTQRTIEKMGEAGHLPWQ